MKLTLSLSKEAFENRIEEKTDKTAKKTLEKRLLDRSTKGVFKHSFYHIKKENEIEIHPHPSLALDSPYLVIKITPIDAQKLELDISYKLYTADITLLFIYAVFTLIIFHNTKMLQTAMALLALVVVLTVFKQNRMLKILLESLIEEEPATQDYPPHQ